MAKTLSEIIQLTDFGSEIMNKKYQRMTELYEMLLPKSLEYDQFALVEMCGSEYPHPDWNEFLNLAQVSVWIENQVHNMVKARSRKAQGNMGVNDAKVLLSIVEKRQGEDTKKIVITRLPEKIYDNS